MSPSDIAHNNNGMMSDGWNSGIAEVTEFVVSVVFESGISSESGKEPE
jgi:hypothetical protein